VPEAAAAGHIVLGAAAGRSVPEAAARPFAPEAAEYIVLEAVDIQAAEAEVSLGKVARQEEFLEDN
jgi:hypothetical protein